MSYNYYLRRASRLMFFEHSCAPLGLRRFAQVLNINYH